MKNKQKLSANNGVSISYKVEANERIKIPFFNEIMLTLLAIIASVGAIMTFSTVLDFRVSPGIVISAIAVFSIIYTVLYKLIKKRRYLVILGAISLAAIVALIFFADFSKGATIIFDQSVATIHEFMFWDEPSQTYVWQDEFIYLTNFVTILLAMALCSAISYFTSVRQSFLAIFLLTFPFFEIGAAFGAVPNYVYFSLMLASWAASLTISRVSNSKIKMRRSNGEKQKKEINGSKQKFAGIAVVMAMVVVLLFTSITAYLNSIDFTRTENVDKLRTETKYAFDDFIDYITGVDHDGSLKEGKLYAVEDRVVKNRHYITMQTNIVSIDEPMKIKGYTATVYKDNCWNQTDNFDDYEEMFDSFNDFSYKMGVNTGYLLSSSPDFADMDFGDITMSDFRRKKSYAYEVYFADLSGKNYTTFYDSSVEPEDNSEYTYTSYLSTQYISKVPNTEIYKDSGYRQAFSQYRTFVMQEYTKSEVPDSVSELAMNLSGSDKFSYLNSVRIYLRDNLEHTPKSGKCPGGEDFVENFLFNSKKGYSTHFATAATVLLQAKGYAARYVEGYYIPAKTFNNTPTENVMNYKTIDITDKYAHAWIEIFDETYGWIPVEVTPGYWTEDDLNISGPQDSPDKGDVDHDSETVLPEDVLIPSLDAQVKDDFNIVDKEVSTKIEWTTPDVTTLLEVLFAILLTLVLIVAIIFVIHLILAASKKKLYASDDVNKKLKYAYRYLSRLAAYQKIKIANTYDYMGLAEYMGDKVFYITVDKLKSIFNVFLRHAYSPAPATLEEANEVLRELQAYTDAIYADLNKIEKILYKYLRNLK